MFFQQWILEILHCVMGTGNNSLHEGAVQRWEKGSDKAQEDIIQSAVELLISVMNSWEGTLVQFRCDEKVPPIAFMPTLRLIMIGCLGLIDWMPRSNRIGMCRVTWPSVLLASQQEHQLSLQRKGSEPLLLLWMRSKLLGLMPLWV